MLRRELDFELPEDLIAQTPVEPRDASRLLMLDRGHEKTDHAIFRDLPRRLRPGDILVANDTRVIPARFFARRASGGRVEAFFLSDAGAGWRVLLRPSARLALDEELTVLDRGGVNTLQRIRIIERHERGEWLIRADGFADPLPFLERFGSTPLPPYIRRPEGPAREDSTRYQTVYAAVPGAVAAPTAGLHFTQPLLETLAREGVKFARLTLHVGLGTFAPLDVEDLRHHTMHSETWRASAATLRDLHAARLAGGRIIAVGTTVARVLESLPLRLGDPSAPPDAVDLGGETAIFIYPPYEFRNVDALITNFHLPRSTLLALVMAFAGVMPVRRAYAQAVERRYRFFSYGDAMFIT